MIGGAAVVNMDDLEKYEDFTVLTLEMLNARRSFNFELRSLRLFRKMLLKNKVARIVMSHSTFLKVEMMYNYLEFFKYCKDIRESQFQYIVTWDGVRAAINNLMEDNKILMLNCDGEAIVVNVTE